MVEPQTREERLHVLAKSIETALGMADAVDDAIIAAYLAACQNLVAQRIKRL